MMFLQEVSYPSCVVLFSVVKIMGDRQSPQARLKTMLTDYLLSNISPKIADSVPEQSPPQAVLQQQLTLTAYAILH